MKQTAARGTTAKHASSKTASSKHSPKSKKKTPAAQGASTASTVAKPPTQAKARKFTPDGSVALCSARAVAESLRLATGTVLADDEVLGLYWATAGDADAGQTILEALTAAQSVPGFPVWRALADFPLCPAGSDASDGASFGGLFPGCGQLSGSVPRPGDLAAVILGLNLPEPHAVAVAPDGTWWSWGQPWQPPADAVIEEAWCVQWQ